MLAHYHHQMIQIALQSTFQAADLELITAANLGQDSLRGLLNPLYHFDDSRFSDSEQYIAEQRRTAVAAIIAQQDRTTALQAFGRLLHGRQDFYAHSNWVSRWVDAQGGLANCRPEDTPICPDPTAVPGLISGRAAIPLYLLYRVPLLGPLVRRFYFPPDTHDAMNLDDPGRGPLFAYAIAAAIKHTRVELDLLLQELESAGGETAVAHFLGRKRGE